MSIQKRILVVDDDQGILEAFTAILESANYQVITASSQESLNKILSKNLPDLMLLDVLLSGIDGREVCKELKSKEKTKGLPIIIISAHPSAGKSIKAAGADDFLEKPFDMEVLLRKIDRLTANR